MATVSTDQASIATILQLAAGAVLPRCLHAVANLGVADASDRHAAERRHAGGRDGRQSRCAGARAAAARRERCVRVPRRIVRTHRGVPAAAFRPPALAAAAGPHVRPQRPLADRRRHRILDSHRKALCQSRPRRRSVGVSVQRRGGEPGLRRRDDGESARAGCRRHRLVRLFRRVDDRGHWRGPRAPAPRHPRRKRRRPVASSSISLTSSIRSKRRIA